MRSRSSSWPSSSRSRSRLSDSACARLGGRRVVLVHVRGDVLEQQRPGERRGGRRLDLHHRDLARSAPAARAARRVEPVVEALAVGLEDHREAAEAPRHLQQRGGLEALLPQGCRCPGAPSRDEAPGPRSRGSGPRARPSRRARRAPAPRAHRAGSARCRPRAPRPRRAGGGRCRRRPRWRGPADPVAVRSRAARASAGCVDPGAEQRQHAQPPVADLVAEALDHHRAVVRHHAGGKAAWSSRYPMRLPASAVLEGLSSRRRAVAGRGPAAISSRASRPTASPSS